MKTKYDFDFNEQTLESCKKRLVNQLWKLIPMKENGEDWEKQLNNVIVEIAGLNTIFVKELSFLTLLSKLEGLKYSSIDFMIYRKTIFETINLVGELWITQN